MGLLAEYEVGCEHLPLVGVARDVPEATIAVSMVPHADGHTPFIVRVPEGDPAAVEDAFGSADFVAEYAPLGGGDPAETRRYKVHPALGFEAYLGPHVDDLDGLRALATGESTIERIEVTPDGWVYSGWFAHRGVLDEFRSFWQGEGYPFRIRRLTRDDDRYVAGSGDSRGGLTDRQREALRVAYEMGYFEIPRGASLADVAAELGITASSCSERLRRAQTHLLETRVDFDRRSEGGLKRPQQ